MVEHPELLNLRLEKYIRERVAAASKKKRKRKTAQSKKKAPATRKKRSGAPKLRVIDGDA